MFFFFKQKTAYEMRISDWSSDVCSSDLVALLQLGAEGAGHGDHHVERARRVAAPLRRHEVVIVEADRVAPDAALHLLRSEERRVGKECVSTCRSRWSPYH